MLVLALLAPVCAALVCLEGRAPACCSDLPSVRVPVQVQVHPPLLPLARRLERVFMHHSNGQALVQAVLARVQVQEQAQVLAVVVVPEGALRAAAAEAESEAWQRRQPHLVSADLPLMRTTRTTRGMTASSEIATARMKQAMRVTQRTRKRRRRRSRTRQAQAQALTRSMPEAAVMARMTEAALPLALGRHEPGGRGAAVA